MMKDSLKLAWKKHLFPAARRSPRTGLLSPPALVLSTTENKIKLVELVSICVMEL